MIVNRNKVLIITIIISIVVHILLLQISKQERNATDGAIYVELVKVVAKDKMLAKKQPTAKVNKSEQLKRKIIPEKIADDIESEPLPDVAHSVQTDNDTQTESVETVSNDIAKEYIRMNYDMIRKKIIKSIVYPSVAKKLNIEGSGVLLITINADGKIGMIEVVADFGNMILTDAAIKAVKSVGKVDAVGVQIKVEVPISFSLY